MPHGAQKAQNVRQPTKKLHEPTDDPRPSGLHLRGHPEHNRHGTSLPTQGNMMKEVVTNQKTTMGSIDIDKLDDLRDEMDDLKY
jgi:hypothetical protein